MRFKFLLSICTAAVLTACATSGVTVDDAAKVVGKHYPKGSVMIEVPSAANAISEAMMLGMLKSSSSQSADALATMLKSKEPVIVVFGKSDSMVAATVERAIKDVRNAIPKGKTLAIIGEAKDFANIVDLASSVGLKVEFIAPPAKP